MHKTRANSYGPFFEAANDGILIVDLDTETILDVNRRMAEIIGLPHSGIVGSKIEDFLDEGSTWPTGKISYCQEGLFKRWLKRNDGTTILVEISVGLEQGDNQPLAIMIARSITSCRDIAKELESAHSLLNTISSAQSQSVNNASLKTLLGNMLEDILQLTGSEVGFIGDVPRTLEGTPYLKMRAISASAWKLTTRDFFTNNAPIGMEFYKLDNLLCAPIKEQQIVIANDVQNDVRAHGLPPHHPPIHSYLGLPIIVKGAVVGLIGVANRLGGYNHEQAALLETLLKTCATLIENYNNNQWREEAETKLHRQSLVFENISDGVILTSEDGYILDCNPAVLKTFGFSKREMQGAPIDLMLDGGKHGLFDKVLSRLKDQGKWSDILTIAHKDGHEIVCELFVFQLKDNGDESGTLLWLVHDITERVAAAHALETRTIELDAILNLSPDGFVFVDGSNRVAYLNPAFEQMTGLSAGKLVGTDRVSFEAALDQLTDLVATSQQAFSPRQDGAEIITLSTPRFSILRRVIRFLETESGETQGMVQCYQDITKETEIDRMKSQFLSTAAHELRTPMASVFGFSELLLKRKFDAERTREFIEIIHRQVGNLITMLNELLDIARIEARAGRDFKIATHDLKAIINATLDGLMVPNDPRHVTPDWPHHPLEVKVDPEKMQLALTNVLSNAYKYSLGKGDIILSIRKRGFHGKTQIGIAVRDQGIGMTPEQKSHVFDRFYRADASGKIPGTGLGLSLVKEIMDIFGGETEISSEPNKGTEVILWLPSAEKSA